MGAGTRDHEAALLDLAWTGDAVLALWMRELMLANGLRPDAQRGELFKRFTCNQFLSAFGRPTEVEARIGTVYYESGLAGAFEFLNALLLPVMSRQLANMRNGVRLDKPPIARLHKT